MSSKEKPTNNTPATEQPPQDASANAPAPGESGAAYLTGIEYPQPFGDYAVQLCREATRYVCILSPTLDHRVFDNEALVDALSALARRSRQTSVRILVSDPRAIVGRGHRLLQLSRRLPSTVYLHKLAEHPDWNGETIVIRDRNGVLYKPGGAEHDAFFEPDGRATAEQQLELFEELWRYSSRDPELRALSI